MRFSNIIFVLNFILISYQVLSFDVFPSWGSDFVPQVKFVCQNEEEDVYCNHLCGQSNECVIEEGFCRDCAGANLTLRQIFLEVGDRLVRTEYPVFMREFLDFLREGDFVTLTSKSIYNFVDHYDSMMVKAQFQKLCSDKDEYPLLFLKVDHYSRLIENIEFVVCQNLYDERTLIFRLEKPRPFVPLPVRYSE